MIPWFALLPQLLMSYTIEKHEYSDIIQDLFVLQNHENKICLKSAPVSVYSLSLI